MAGEVVEDDDIAGIEGWGELGLDVALESEPVDRTVKQPGGCQSIASEACNEGLRAPVPEGRGRPPAWPRGPRPRRRVILVVVEVSSRKTKR